MLKKTDNHNFVAVDIGAGSGRLVLGLLRNGRIRQQELHRFPNKSIRVAGHMRWNMPILNREIIAGLAKSISFSPMSMGIDTWGVDYALLDAKGNLLELPVCYSDQRTSGAMESFCKTKMSAEDLYRRTGVQRIYLNTVFQLYAALKENRSFVRRARRLLFVPDYLNWLLTGKQVCEATAACTSGMLNVRHGIWDKEILAALGLDPAIFLPLTPAGSSLGLMCPAMQKATGLYKTEVVLPACHDTASATVALPALAEDWMFISTGTWCLAGMEVSRPVLSARARKENFTNEGLINGRYRFLRNVMGLKLVRDLRADYRNRYTYEELESMASAAPALQSFIDPNHELFKNPSSLCAAIDTFCKQTGQRLPATPGEYLRTIFESLALMFNKTAEDLRKITGRRIAVIHMVGGGIAHRQLCRMTANACGIKVVAGPAEATALGNILMQAIGQGLVKDLDHAREIAASSVPIKEYLPGKQSIRWENAYSKFECVLNQ